ncbi:MAG: ParB/RepB/Spo0J family partition protein [Firmicutes bacterium]|nr:ParB/RepB/Spo0J family partition protein [Bacillota bacterium]
MDTKYKEIDITLIDPYPCHPFKVDDDGEMTALCSSIRDIGLMFPIVVRQKVDGRYELISGHRRKRACELLGYKTIKCRVVDLTNEKAAVFMVDSNLSRQRILPSELAFSYKIKRDALSKQGLFDDAKIQDTFGVSRTQFYRYISLIRLIPELLDYVDAERMKMRPAVEISYLDETHQKMLLDAINYYDATPSHTQARRLREQYENGGLDENMIYQIMSEEKPNQKEHVALDYQTVKGFVPKNIPDSKLADFICYVLKQYAKARKKTRQDKSNQR